MAMARLDLAKIEAQAAEKKAAQNVRLTAVTHVLLAHLLSLLDDNQWLFIEAGEAERDATDRAMAELLRKL